MSEQLNKCEVGFYHLTRVSLDQALPRLLEKVIATRKNAVLIAGSEQRVEQVNRNLWTFRTDSFLPHGAKQDGFAEKQPIYLTSHTDDRPNGPQIIICIDNVECSDLAGIEKCLDVFDGNDPAAVAEARKRWTAAKAAGLAVTYWKQNERGGWTRAV